MRQTKRALRVAAVLVGCVASGLTLPGCGEAAPSRALTATEPEPSLATQAEAIRQGRADAIRLDRSLVRDDDLAPLDDLGDKLRRVNLSHTEITDAGLEKLCRHAGLEQLRLSSSRVTDAGLAHVAKLKHLRFLHLLDAPITDAGLDQLHRLETLESLYLDRTRVTDEGLARLIAARPGVHLHIDEHHHPLDPHAKEHAH